MSSGPGPLPNFVIIGALRCGTTSLHRALASHPDIFVAPGKELHFFDLHYDRGVDWYRERFAGAAAESALGEATPNYFDDSAALVRMAEVIPDARLLVQLRNPVDRAYSHYWHNQSIGREPLDFGAAVDAEIEGNRDTDLPARYFTYVARGRYLDRLKEVLRHYPRDALHIGLLDDWQANPLPLFRSVCRHLGVDDTVEPIRPDARVNAFVAFRSAALRNRTAYLPKALRVLVARLNRQKSSSYPPMDPAIRAALIERFAPENAALADFLGVDLSAWSS